jgi:3-phenylpropionate/trans-cinnamate dioxygenase ferredoxin reductase component
MTSAAGALVIGASAAGLAAADGLREGGWTGPITVLSEELRLPYDRTMLSKKVFSDAAAEPAVLRTEQQLAEREINLRLGHAARGLDIDRRLVVTSDGEALPYDALVLATGSRPTTMATGEGHHLPTLRTVDDAEALRVRIKPETSVTLIGTGFIGLEVAAALRGRGVAVTVVGLETLPMADCLGGEVASWLWNQHQAQGLQAHLGNGVASISGGPGDYSVLLEGGQTIQSQVVMVAVGVVPRDEWLIGSGVYRSNGVVCDAAGRTNVRDVWVAGDLARMDGAPDQQALNFGHWTNAIEQGRNVGLNIAQGRASPYHRLRSFWTEQHGYTIRSIGTRKLGDVEETVEGEISAGEFVVLHRGDDDALHGVTACRRDRSLRAYRKLLLRGGSVAEARALAQQQRT